MLKVKINDEWIENVVEVKKWINGEWEFVISSENFVRNRHVGKIQDIKWVEDECEHHWFDEDGTQVCSRCGKTIIQVQNEQDEPEEIERLKMAVMNEGEMLIQEQLES